MSLLIEIVNNYSHIIPLLIQALDILILLSQQRISYSFILLSFRESSCSFKEKWDYAYD